MYLFRLPFLSDQSVKTVGTLACVALLGWSTSNLFNSSLTFASRFVAPEETPLRTSVFGPFLPGFDAGDDAFVVASDEEAAADDVRMPAVFWQVELQNIARNHYAALAPNGVDKIEEIKPFGAPNPVNEPAVRVGANGESSAQEDVDVLVREVTSSERNRVIEDQTGEPLSLANVEGGSQENGGIIEREAPASIVNDKAVPSARGHVVPVVVATEDLQLAADPRAIVPAAAPTDQDEASVANVPAQRAELTSPTGEPAFEVNPVAPQPLPFEMRPVAEVFPAPIAAIAPMVAATSTSGDPFVAHDVEGSWPRRLDHVNAGAAYAAPTLLPSDHVLGYILPFALDDALVPKANIEIVPYE